MEDKSKKRRQNSKSKSGFNNTPLTKEQLSQLLKTDYRAKVFEITGSAKNKFLSQIQEPLNIYIQNLMRKNQEETKIQTKSKTKTSNLNIFSDQEINLSSDHNQKPFLQPTDPLKPFDDIDLTNEEEQIEQNFLKDDPIPIQYSQQNKSLQEGVPINTQVPMNSQESNEYDEPHSNASVQSINNDVLLSELNFEEEEMALMEDLPQIVNKKHQNNNIINVSPVNSNSDSNPLPTKQNNKFNENDYNANDSHDLNENDEINFNSFNLRKISGNNSSIDTDIDIQVEDI